MHATVYEVKGLTKGRSYLAGLDHFDLRRAGTVPTDTLLNTPHLSLYAFDDAERCAVFVETPPETDLTSAPLYYLAQKKHARRLFTLSYGAFNGLAQTLSDFHLVLLYSVGRCGSTLLCKALGQLGDVVTLSEPDVYTHIAGMRPPDGSRDQELTELAGSATRFLCHSETPRRDTVWTLKFRSQCVEMADLLYEACPGAHALFLARDFTGWMRSMGRLSKIHDPDREASYQQSRPNPTMFIYPRDRYISLLRADPTPPETRLEDIALHWTSIIKRFLDLYGRGVIRYSLTYDDLVRHPERALQAVATACHLPVNDLDDALAVFAHDSQAGTDLSGKLLREQSAHELTEDDLRRARAVAQRHGLEPDTALHLPGPLLDS